MERDMELIRRILPSIDMSVEDMKLRAFLGNDYRPTYWEDFGNLCAKISKPMERVEKQLETLNDEERAAFSTLQHQYSEIVERAVVMREGVAVGVCRPHSFHTRCRFRKLSCKLI
jgi:hypothetical protein